MSNYKETMISGETNKWRRAENVVIVNIYGQNPTIIYNEEFLISLPDGSVIPGPGITDPKLVAEFDATNPLHGQIYYTLNQLYVLLREARDAKIIADAEALAAQETTP